MMALPGIDPTPISRHLRHYKVKGGIHEQMFLYFKTENNQKSLRHDSKSHFWVERNRCS